MSDMCAIGAWRYMGGVIVHDVWLKRRDQVADLVNELIEMRFESIKVDTADGVFIVIEDGVAKHASEFYEWMQGRKRRHLW